MASPYKLPLLPGMAIDPNAGRTSFRKSQNLTYRNNTQNIKGDSDQPVGKESSRVAQYSQGGLGSTQPAWMAFDRQVLCFSAYFQEPVHELRGEQFRVRRVKILFYMEDGTIQVNEKVTANSGIPQGTLIRRHRIPKPAPYDDEVYDVDDLNLGREVTMYGRTYKIVDCDRFTRNFLTKLGIRLGEPCETPEDPHAQALEEKKDSMQPLRPYEKTDTLKKFLEHDGQVLSFKALWDDTDSMFGDRRRLTVSYFLADDTIEVTEIFPRNSGRDTGGAFLKRQKLPRKAVGLGLPGATTKKTVLNVFGNMTKGRHVLDSLRVGASDNEFYTEEDLMIGNQLNVFGRSVLLTDCDDFTKYYYNTCFNVSDFTPISFAEEEKVAPKPREYPPHTGIGTEEDSLVSCISLIPKPPKQDHVKLMQKSRCGLESNVLRFEARLDTAESGAKDRPFTISYFLEDDTVMIFERPTPNSGIQGGKMKERGKVKLPDGSRRFEASDFFIGARVEISKFKFVIINADQYAINYMRLNKFPHSDFGTVMQAARGELSGREEDARATFAKLDTDGSGKVSGSRFRLSLLKLSEDRLSEQQIHTIAHAFSADRTISLDLEYLLLIVHTDLRRGNFDKFDALAAAFKSFDRAKSGSLDGGDIRGISADVGVSTTDELLTAVLAEMPQTESGGLVDYTLFSSLIDYRKQPCADGGDVAYAPFIDACFQ